MSINTQSYVDALASKLLASGHFVSVNGHEPKNPPVLPGITGAVWVTRLTHTEQFTSLAATSAYLVFTIRLYNGMLTEPQDAIDPTLMDATDAVFELITGDFTLGDAVDHVDLLGAGGVSLEAVTGYVTIGSTMYRVVDITVPLVVGDAWTQAR